jgi:hypothetical protein
LRGGHKIKRTNVEIYFSHNVEMLKKNHFDLNLQFRRSDRLYWLGGGQNVKMQFSCSGIQFPALFSQFLFKKIVFNQSNIDAQSYSISFEGAHGFVRKSRGSPFCIFMTKFFEDSAPLPLPPPPSVCIYAVEVYLNYSVRFIKKYLSTRKTNKTASLMFIHCNAIKNLL